MGLGGDPSVQGGLYGCQHRLLVMLQYKRQDFDHLAIPAGFLEQQGLQALEGSWEYTFEYDDALGNVTVEKGSICVNGISLTVVNSQANSFSVAIIPYTYQHTNLHNVREGSVVNLEFDIIGKYVARLMQR